MMLFWDEYSGLFGSLQEPEPWIETTFGGQISTQNDKAINNGMINMINKEVLKDILDCLKEA